MPELPEVECVRRTLAERLVGRRVVSADLRRMDVLQPVDRMRRGDAAATRAEAGEVELLAGRLVRRVVRHGKRLAVEGDDGSAVGVHLGMSGRLLWRAAGSADAGGPGGPGEPGVEPFEGRHTHCRWRLDDGSTLAFVDHRRFGGLWDWPAGATWFVGLGPDATAIRPRQLHEALGGTRRAVKAALLDQAVVAGLGNIYVDELLHQAGLHPLSPADALDLPSVQRLVRAMRRLLGRAIEAGGSTLRDYVDAEGRAGAFALRHRVYGRGGEPCRSCRTPLLTLVVAGRTTTACPRCQPLPDRSTSSARSSGEE